MTAVVATIAAVVIAFVAVWVASLSLRDVSIVDGLWGPAFVLAAWCGYALVANRTDAALLIVLAVTVWGLRLGGHLIARHATADAEDARYAQMRAAGGPAFPITALFKVFLLQAVVLLIVAAPIHAAVFAPAPAAPWLVGLGLGVFAVGLAIEWIADRQLARFRRDAANRGRTLTRGLRAIVRHPNYLGEIVLWWGLGLAGLGASGQWWALVGPAVLTGLLIKVSGVPLLAAHLAATRPDYAAYAAKTPALLPRLRR